MSKSHNMLCQLSKELYKDNHKSKLKLKGNKTPLNFHFVAVDNIECGVAWDNEDVIVAFRGSNLYEEDKVINLDYDCEIFTKIIDLIDLDGKFADWYTNLQLSKLETPIGDVHRGFYIALGKVYRRLCRILRRVYTENKNLYTTGHSLGGALATLFAVNYAKDIGIVAENVVFGCPRVGGSRFKDIHDKSNVTTVRYVNNNDFVCRVPLTVMGYTHIGKEEYLGLLGNFGRWGRIPKFIDRKVGMVFGGLLLDGISDHNIEEYLKRV